MGDELEVVILGFLGGIVGSVSVVVADSFDGDGVAAFFVGVLTFILGIALLSTAYFFCKPLITQLLFN